MHPRKEQALREVVVPSHCRVSLLFLVPRFSFFQSRCTSCPPSAPGLTQLRVEGGRTNAPSWGVGLFLYAMIQAEDHTCP